MKAGRVFALASGQRDAVARRVEPAPLERTISGAVADADAVWTDAQDGVRLRLGLLGRGDRGTVVILPGRTEFIEKYAAAGRRFAAAGYASVAIDFRGQGLSERLLPDPALGHVGRFADYQLDVAALTDFAAALELPRPWFLLGHSMGGAIGLRAVIEGLPVAGAVFSAPMWGIVMPRALVPVAWTLGGLAHLSRRDGWITPMTLRETYARLCDPDDNFLTSDPAMILHLRRMLDAQPGLDLGGPSLPWLYRALAECRALRARAMPPVPTLTALPTEEAIVSAAAIRQMTARWPNGTLLEIAGGKHETLMETPERQDRFFAALLAFFDRVGRQTGDAGGPAAAPGQSAAAPPREA